MKIGIIGLGLIGGSFCRAIKEKTQHSCYGMDIDKSVIAAATAAGAIDGELNLSEISSCDLTIIALHPAATINFVKENISYFGRGIVIDVCGIKKTIVDALAPLFRANKTPYIGTHPMAGREFSGFEYSLSSLFENASFILTPSSDEIEENIEFVRNFAVSLGFHTVITDVEKHDATIAFTSQLAHIISNGYVKSPTLQNESGFSAGSFLDLSRVAKLNPGMWTELFLMNKAALSFEIETLIDHLTEYKTALDNKDSDALYCLLKDGSDLKEESLRRARK